LNIEFNVDPAFHAGLLRELPSAIFAGLDILVLRQNFEIFTFRKAL